MRSGDNRVSWPNGCCNGDLVTIDFRDEQVRCPPPRAWPLGRDSSFPPILLRGEQADGNTGFGILYINNTENQPNTVETYAEIAPRSHRDQTEVLMCRDLPQV